MMKTSFKKQLLIVAALTSGLLAGAPFSRADKPRLNVQQLAITESVLKFCGAVDADAAKKLQDKVAQLVQGASEDALAKARASDDYRHAYDLVMKFTGQVDERNAKTVCTNQLADTK